MVVIHSKKRMRMKIVVVALLSTIFELASGNYSTTVQGGYLNIHPSHGLVAHGALADLEVFQLLTSLWVSFGFNNK